MLTSFKPLATSGNINTSWLLNPQLSSMGVLDTEQLDRVSMQSLAAVARRMGGLKLKDTRSRALLYAAMSRLPKETSRGINDEVQLAVNNGETKYKRKRDDEGNMVPSERRKRLKREVSLGSEIESINIGKYRIVY